MTTETDCHYVIGCSDRQDGAAREASRWRRPIDRRLRFARSPGIRC